MTNQRHPVKCMILWHFEQKVQKEKKKILKKKIHFMIFESPKFRKSKLPPMHPKLKSSVRNHPLTAGKARWSLDQDHRVGEDLLSLLMMAKVDDPVLSLVMRLENCGLVKYMIQSGEDLAQTCVDRVWQNWQNRSRNLQHLSSQLVLQDLQPLWTFKKVIRLWKIKPDT
uniref:Uncharacterized protein n=1 Tax=Cacopsylla melanoneura TaxID=428564 RepID=A0A8D8U390_9HEMI